MDTSKFKYKLGQHLRKKTGSQWEGKVVGFYSTELTPEGYAIESSTHAGSVQIYPKNALEPVLILTKGISACEGCYYFKEYPYECPFDETTGKPLCVCKTNLIWIQA